MTITELKDIATILGASAALLGATFAIYKGLQELEKNRQQREIDHKLRRAEFTLAQHRRLFDDPVLCSVLELLDDDHSSLAKHNMWNAKRKFLTFMEELCLLVNANLIDENVAHYLFGYYAGAAYTGRNFQIGMAWEAKHWGLFFEFAKKSNQKLDGEEPSFAELKKLSV